MEDFFPRIQVETSAQMQTRVQIIGGMQMQTVLKLFPHTQIPPRVSAPLLDRIHRNETFYLKQHSSMYYFCSG